MVNLSTRSPAEGLLPYKNADCTLSEQELGTITSLAPLKDKTAALEEALGMALPKNGGSILQNGQEIVWFAQGQFLLIGPDAPKDLSSVAAMSDQSDAWCALAFHGPHVDNVLARLVPVDLRESNFSVGSTLRSQLGHMPLHLTRTSGEAFRLMSFRSMAKTMVHEITRSLDFLAARG